MMQSGLSRELFETWCSDKKSGVIVAGYCVEGTLAKQLLNDSPSEITTMAGQRVKVNCSIDYISFSAHTDYKQTTQFVRALKPAHIILVHGEQTEMAKLKDALIRQYEDSTDYNIQVYNPKNTQPVELYFRGEKTAKVVGKLASNILPKEDNELSGILVKRNFKYHIMSPEDLPNYTNLPISSILQRLSIPIRRDPLDIVNSFQRVFGNVKQVTSSSSSSSSSTTDQSSLTTTTTITNNLRIKLFDSIEILFEPNYAVLEWDSSPLNDFYADSIFACMLKLEVNEHNESIDSVKMRSSSSSAAAINNLNQQLKNEINKRVTYDLDYEERLMCSLRDMFDERSIEYKPSESINVNVDDRKLNIDLKNLVITCKEDEYLEQIVSNLVKQVKFS